MKKKILIFLLPIFIITLSCRTESESLENFKPNNEAAKRFALFPKRDPAAKDANSFRYDKAFAFLAGKYDSLHKSNITGLVNTTNKARYNKSSKQLLISKSSEAYIEFRLHSQAVFEENGDIWMLFPKIGKNNVEDLVVAILSEGQTKLHYKTISRSSDLFTRNVSRFRSAYSNYFNTDPEGNVSFMSYTSRCGFEGEAPCEIPEVIISPPPRDGGGGYHGDLPGNGDNPPDGGGCAVYLECEPDDQEVGGGGNGSQQDGDPCAKARELASKMAEILNNKDIKEAIQIINNLMKQQIANGQIKENAFAIGIDSNGKYHVSAISTATDSKPHNVAYNHFDPSSGITQIGVFHNHTSDNSNSPGDFYELISSNMNYPSYITNFAQNSHGEVFALNIYDRQKAMAFLQKYPKEQYTDGPEFKGELLADYFRFRSTADWTVNNNTNAGQVALVAFLEKFDTGVSLSKKIDASNFKTFKSSNFSQTFYDGQEQTTYTTTDCN